MEGKLLLRIELPASLKTAYQEACTKDQVTMTDQTINLIRQWLEPTKERKKP